MWSLESTDWHAREGGEIAARHGYVAPAKMKGNDEIANVTPSHPETGRSHGGFDEPFDFVRSPGRQRHVAVAGLQA